MNTYKPEIEFQPKEVIKKFQEKELQQALVYLNAKSPFYQTLFAKEHLDCSKINTLEDLTYIPVTTKADLQKHNEEFYCVPKTQFRDYITTSGTLSDPTTFALTAKDLDRLAYNEAISFTCADGYPGEIYQLMTTLDKRFMAGLAYFMGVVKMGGSMIRVGNGIPELQWDTIQRIHPTTIVCVPSFILHILKYAEEKGIDYQHSSIKKAVCIGENLRNEDFSLNLLGSKIKSKWDINLYSTYASTEMSTTFCECGAGKGGHHHPELIICELLDDHNNPVAAGDAGELTITTLGVEGMPLLRFKTGDIATFHSEPCTCGRHTMRISPIIGRKNQMIKLKGTTLYPATIFDVLDNTDYVCNYLVEVSDNELGTDCVTVRIGSKTPSEQLLKDLQDRFRARLRVTPHIVFDDIDTIQHIQMPDIKRKPVKFIDLRKK